MTNPASGSASDVPSGNPSAVAPFQAGAGSPVLPAGGDAGGNGRPDADRSHASGDCLSQGGDGPARVYEELVRRAQAGSKEAYSELVRSFERQAMQVAHSILNNRQDVEEVVQEAFLSVWKNLQTLAKPGAFPAFLKRTVKNLSFNARRNRSLRANPGLSEGVLEGELNPTQPAMLSGSVSEYSVRSTRPSRAPEMAELMQRLHQALEELPDVERAVVAMFLIERMPQKEIAEVLEISVDMVKWHVYRARRKILSRLKDHL